MNGRNRGAWKPEAGVTLMELLIAVTLLSLLSVGMVVSLRIGLSAMNKADSKLMSNRRVASVERILEQEVAGIMPVSAECRAPAETPFTQVSFFQGEEASMRFASSYSLQQGARGTAMILEYQVIPGENHQGVRLVVNERLYTGPRGAGLLCSGVASDPNGRPIPQFLPIEIGPGSFVLADKLAYCRFSYREMLLSPPGQSRWLLRWASPMLPNAIRIEMAPLIPDPSRLEPVTLTIPVRVTREPLGIYVN